MVCVGRAASDTSPVKNYAVETTRMKFSRDYSTPGSSPVVVVVFFTLTDRASTTPNNTRGCQSGTWSAGQKKIRGTSTKLQ